MSESEGQDAHSPPAQLNARNREIAQVLHRARLRAGKSLRECAELIGTSRQRLAAIEAGRVFIAAVELEALVRFLSINAHEVLPADMVAELEQGREVTVQAYPGESLRIRVNVLREPDSAEGEDETHG